jgi:hypothetical protein
MLEVMTAADECGARYAILSNGELAIYTVRSALPPDLWHALHSWRQDIALGMAVLGIEGPVELGELIRLIEEYDQRPARPQ